jgi:hypothetical protein
MYCNKSNIFNKNYYTKRMIYIKNYLDSFIEYENKYSNNCIKNIISLYKSGLSINIISTNDNNNLMILEKLLNDIMIDIEPSRTHLDTEEQQFIQLSKFYMINVNSKMETYLNNNLKYNGKKTNTELNLFQLNYTDDNEEIPTIKLILIDFKKLKFTEQKYYFLILEYLFNLNHLDKTKYKLIILHFDIILDEFISKTKEFIEKYNVQIITINKHIIPKCKGFLTNIPLHISKDKILKYYLDSFNNDYKILKDGCYNIFHNVYTLCNLDIIKIDMMYEEFTQFCIKRKLITTQTVKKQGTKSKVTKLRNIIQLTSTDICYYEYEFINYLINNKEPKFIFIKLCYELLSIITLNMVLDFLICDLDNLSNTKLDKVLTLTSLQKSKILKLYYFNIEKIKQLTLTTGVFYHSLELYMYSLQSFISWYIGLCNNSLNDFISGTETIKNYLDIILLNKNDNSYKFVKHILLDYSKNRCNNNNECNSITNVIKFLNTKINIKYKNIYKTLFFESNNKNIDNKFNMFYYTIIDNLL